MANKLAQRLADKTKGLNRQPEPEATAKQQPAEVSTDAPSAAAEVPPAPVVRAPRTPTTMPGQLGAFRNEAQRYVAQIAERDAIIEQLTNATDRIRKIALPLVDDSPYQPRLEYDPEEIDALAKTMAAATQADPIKVRKVDDRYELISGHRRVRAARSLGWTEIDAIVENRTDAQAELEAMLLVIGNVPLSDYELAKMYRRAMDKGFCKTQREAAAMFGVSQPAIAGCLDMLALPEAVVEMLEAKPSLFGYATGNTIKQLVKEYPKHLDIIVKGVRRLVEEGATQGSLKGWVLQAIAQVTRKAKPPQDTRTITKDGHEVFTTKKTANAVTVSIKARDLDNGQFEKDLHQWLKEYAQRTGEQKAEEKQ